MGMSRFSSCRQRGGSGAPVTRARVMQRCACRHCGCLGARWELPHGGQDPCRPFPVVVVVVVVVSRALPTHCRYVAFHRPGAPPSAGIGHAVAHGHSEFGS